MSERRQLWLVTWGTTGSLVKATTEEFARREWARAHGERLRRLGLDPKSHGIEVRVRLATDHEIDVFKRARVERVDARFEPVL